MARKLQVLSPADARHFVEKGYVRVKGCLDPALAKKWTSEAYGRLGYDPLDRSTWTSDIVWMVEKIIGGQPVLVPQVYLSAKTKGLVDPTGATIGGENVALDVGNLTNTGGTLSGSGTLSVKASGDIKNTGGTIGGGDVSLKAGGSITNETVLGGDSSLGKTATISSTASGRQCGSAIRRPRRRTMASTTSARHSTSRPSRPHSSCTSRQTIGSGCL